MDHRKLIEYIISNGEMLFQKKTRERYAQWYAQAESALTEVFGEGWGALVVWEGYSHEDYYKDKDDRIARALDYLRPSLQILPTSEQPQTEVQVPAASTGVGDSARTTVLVLTALYDELDHIVRDSRATDRLPLTLTWKRDELSLLKIDYWQTPIAEDYRIVAVTPDSMGLTEMAIVATACFKKFRPAMAAMVGICAGRYERDVRLGHIIVPTQAFHYQFGARTEAGLEPEIRSADVNSKYTTAAARVGGHKDFSTWMNEGHPQTLKPKALPKYHVGPMACSDYVAKWDQLVKNAADMDRKVVGIDMESYAFLRAARRCGMSQDSFIVKCVTDYADKDKDDSVREWAQVAAARFFYFVLARWLDDRNTSEGKGTDYWSKMCKP